MAEKPDAHPKVTPIAEHFDNFQALLAYLAETYEPDTAAIIAVRHANGGIRIIRQYCTDHECAMVAARLLKIATLDD